ncbi:RNA polymerase sigma factor [Pedobacter sp. SD-b]|uniref:RNA polymerase sigma factor n=1 Tax=Pedobacter segetis TaxID=2793069 RepID=A0ABS1BHH3_9SPHI|nr:RNA polymerase sigma factor [Pedobacter segetis]MBK0382333.1 RNA polymerase sigma factor [Pedobacter segetis]
MISQKDFKSIYDEYNKLVFNLALSYCQNKDDAQDISQEVFVKLYQKYQQFNPELSSLKTWVYRLTINQSLDFLKSKKTAKRFGFLVSIFKNESREEEIQISDFQHPGIILENKEELQILFSHINSLPPNQKTAIILNKAENRSQKEVAEIMQTSIKAVESLITRAKKNMQKKYPNSEGFKN